MKRTFLIVLILFSFKAYSQVTIPQGFLHNLRLNKDKIEAHAKIVNPASPKSFDQYVQDLEQTVMDHRWFPTFYLMDQTDKLDAMFVQNNVVSYNDSLSNVALYSEIASDYVGPVRVSVGITLAYPKSDSDADEQKVLNQKGFLQKFSTGGGTLAFNVGLPIYNYKSKVFTITSLLAPRFSLDPPAFGLSTGKFAHNTSIGTDLESSLNGIKGVFRFTGATRLSYVAGNSAFYDALQLADDSKKAFWMNNFTLGVIITDKFSLSYTKFFGSDAITQKLKGYLTFTVSPNFDKL